MFLLKPEMEEDVLFPTQELIEVCLPGDIFGYIRTKNCFASPFWLSFPRGSPFAEKQIDFFLHVKHLSLDVSIFYQWGSVPVT